MCGQDGRRSDNRRTDGPIVRSRIPAGLLPVMLCGLLSYVAHGQMSEGVCLGDRLEAPPGSTIKLRYLGPLASGSAIWKVESGEVSNNVWTVGMVPGKHTVKASALTPNGKDVLCTFEIAITDDPLMGNNLETGTDFVRRSAKPVKTGMFSYLIFVGPVNEKKSRERAEVIVGAYLNNLVSVHVLQKSFTPEQINQFLLPIDDFPLADDALIPKEPRLRIKWAVDHLDVGLGKALLSNQAGTWTNGPYILSCLGPLGLGENEKSCVPQDLSLIPEDLMPEWIKAVEYLAAQRQPWNEAKLGSLALRIRTAVELAGEQIPDAAKVVGRVMKLKLTVPDAPAQH